MYSYFNFLCVTWACTMPRLNTMLRLNISPPSLYKKVTISDTLNNNVSMVMYTILYFIEKTEEQNRTKAISPLLCPRKVRDCQIRHWHLVIGRGFWTSISYLAHLVRNVEQKNSFATTLHSVCVQHYLIVWHVCYSLHLVLQGNGPPQKCGLRPIRFVMRGKLLFWLVTLETCVKQADGVTCDVGSDICRTIFSGPIHIIGNPKLLIGSSTLLIDNLFNIV